ncbi:MAG: hypothetical protein ACRDNZ_03505, partial [Streptosporangiaceae bacterium]
VRDHPRLGPHLHYFDHFDAAILPLEQQFAHDDKLELTVGEYAWIGGFEVAGSAVLDQIVLPTMDFSAQASTWTDLSVPVETLDPQQAYRLITDCLLIPDPDGTGWLRELTGAKDKVTDAMRATLRAMAQTQTLRLRGTPEAMLAALLEPGPPPGVKAAEPVWERACGAPVQWPQVRCTSC